ncbi:MAG: nicotinamide-nucleotide amidohydrolase family protein [Woeseiaceae bacterium]
MAEDAIVHGLAQALVTALNAAGKTLSTAESCTGGWVAKALTDIPGSSACFAYGIVSYSNGAKESLLGVRSRTLIDHGAVSADTVAEMVEGALRLSGADLGVAVSGIAGPDGGSDDKPVGTVWFAWAVRGKPGITTDTDRQKFEGSRERIRLQSVVHALRGVQERLET